jgi:hypothetical protein
LVASFVARAGLALECKTDEMISHSPLLILEFKLTSKVNHKARDAVRGMKIKQTRIPRSIGHALGADLGDTIVGALRRFMVNGIKRFPSDGIKKLTAPVPVDLPSQKIVPYAPIMTLLEIRAKLSMQCANPESTPSPLSA